MSERKVRLRGDIDIPQVGLGVFQVPPAEAQRVVEDALAVGYRHVDTAAAYNNESGVGAALRASGLPRDEVFLTSKLRTGEQGYDAALKAYDDTLQRLGIDALDLYLVHWPNPSAGLWQETWRAFEKIFDEGRVRSIGVSNFLPEHLEELASFASHVPVVNQIESHPAFQQRDVIAACDRLGIVVEAYSPLGRGTVLENPVITRIAAAHGVTAAQVVLAWHVQQDRIVIPKTVSRERMISNAALDFALTDEELGEIDQLESGGRTGSDPRLFNKSQIVP